MWVAVPTACCLLLLLSGCCVSQPKGALIHEKDPIATRAELLKLIPGGTPLDQGEAVLVKNGFRKVTNPATWPEPKPGELPKPGGGIDEQAPYVTYWIDVPTDAFVTRCWYVQLYHRGGTIEDIKVTAGGLTGP